MYFTTLAAFAALAGSTMAVTYFDYDNVCPVVPAGNVNAAVLAVVSLHEHATVTVANYIEVGNGVQVATNPTVLTADLDADVCLCVQANVALDAIVVPPTIDAGVQALILPAVGITAGTDSDLLVNGVAHSAADVTVDSQLTPTARQDCTCDAYSIPTCSAGTCGCTPCPNGGLFNLSTNGCVSISASGLARRRNSGMKSYRG